MNEKAVNYIWKLIKTKTVINKILSTLNFVLISFSIGNQRTSSQISSTLKTSLPYNFYSILLIKKLKIEHSQYNHISM